MRQSETKILSSVFLLFFVLGFLYVVSTFVPGSLPSSINLVVIPLLSAILYLIVMGSFLRKAIHHKLQRFVTLMLGSMTATILLYFSLESLYVEFGATGIQIATVIATMVTVWLHWRVLVMIDEVDLEPFKDYPDFAKTLDIPFFGSVEGKCLTLALTLLRIASLIFLFIGPINVFYIYFFTFIFCSVVLYLRKIHHLKSDRNIVCILKKLTVIEWYIYLLIISLVMTGSYQNAMLLLLITHYKNHLIKENIRKKAYLLSKEQEWTVYEPDRIMQVYIFNTILLTAFLRLFSLNLTLFMGFILAIFFMIEEWEKIRNKDYLIETINATIVYKRTEVDNTGRHRTYTYYLTFQGDYGREVELKVSKSFYRRLEEGLDGRLTYQGELFYSFEEIER